MQTYPVFCTLTKDWVSNRFRLYPSGTTFERKSASELINTSNTPGHWYDFKIPNGSFGFVFVPNRVFFRLTDEERKLRALRKEQAAKHTRSHKTF